MPIWDTVKKVVNGLAGEEGENKKEQEVFNSQAEGAVKVVTDSNMKETPGTKKGESHTDGTFTQTLVHEPGDGKEETLATIGLNYDEDIAKKKQTRTAGIKSDIPLDLEGQARLATELTATESHSRKKTKQDVTIRSALIENDLSDKYEEAETFKYDENGRVTSYKVEHYEEDKDQGHTDNYSGVMNFDNAGRPVQYQGQHDEQCPGEEDDFIDNHTTTTVFYKEGRPVGAEIKENGAVTKTKIRKDGSSLTIDENGHKIERDSDKTESWLSTLIDSQVVKKAEEIAVMTAEECAKVAGKLKDLVTNPLADDAKQASPEAAMANDGNASKDCVADMRRKKEEGHTEETSGARAEEPKAPVATESRETKPTTLNPQVAAAMHQAQNE